jgi:DNA-binding protein HU-beta
MNRRELVKAIAAQTGVDAKQVDVVLKGFQDVTTAVAAKGEPVSISGFAKFYRQDRKARMGRNPATGAAIKIPAKKVAKITAMKGFKDSVLKPSEAPKLERGVWPPAPAKKAAAKKSTAKKTAKKSPAKKAAAKKRPAKKAAKKR